MGNLLSRPAETLALSHERASENHLRAVNVLADSACESSSALSQGARDLGQSMERSSALLGCSACFASKLMHAAAGDAVSAVESVVLMALVAMIFCTGVVAAKGEPLLHYGLTMLQMWIMIGIVLTSFAALALHREKSSAFAADTKSVAISGSATRDHSSFSGKICLSDRRVLASFQVVEASTWQGAAEQLVEELAGNKVRVSQIAAITAYNNGPDGSAKLAAFLRQNEMDGTSDLVVTPASLKFHLQNGNWKGWAKFNEESVRFAQGLHGDQLISITNCCNEDGGGVGIVWYRCYGGEEC
ncbi:unnamed protein product [Amoebophrya sp. A25]|nr:unnamed protein product [Amoebophrya sp. A25]|eukprot:GSA25T00025172001.1